jgi:glucose-6-phosphate-specific signal transduction histidine kinase
MSFWWKIVHAGIVLVTLLAVAEMSQRYSRLRALLLWLPPVSVFAFVAGWSHYHELAASSRISLDIFLLAPFLLMYLPTLALAGRMRHGYWIAFTTGVVLAILVIGACYWLDPPTMI